MRKLFLFVIFFATAQVVFATQGAEKKTEPMISGTVVDAATKKPIVDVTIIAINVANKAQHSITTDVNGNFKIATLPFGTYKFKFDKDNYRVLEKPNVTIKQVMNAKINIEMVNYKNENIEEKRNWTLKFDS